ncbi:hypothetical protein NZD88_00800 [Chryseobacterium antibioticum]|uniref:Tetratricopeptide repeat protein n=1 Tax=Chryseobacterium pyrolae TaxID=2987481 RepID=A0ABT2IBS9_9FLAO|nr:tetratricopeptide repeat protein [Chryseobacterium pyrolae]MCT2406090.1 hypothetical protein [Chryseobacterium pyrolae]
MKSSMYSLVLIGVMLICLTSNKVLSQKRDYRFLTDSLNMEQQLDYEATERDFNRLGYQFLRLQQCENSVQTFNTASLIFPKSWNVFDSYGEALLQCGKKEEAMKMYRKSLELNPENTNAKEVIKKMEALSKK